MSGMGWDDMVFLPAGAPPLDEPAYSEDGVDLTLIRWMLDKTPEERLQELQSFHEFLDGVRRANPEWTLAES